MMEQNKIYSAHLNTKSGRELHRNTVSLSRENQSLQRQVTDLDKQKKHAGSELRFLRQKFIDRAAAKCLVPQGAPRDHRGTDKNEVHRFRSHSSPVPSSRPRGSSFSSCSWRDDRSCGSPVVSRCPPNTTRNSPSLLNVTDDHLLDWNPGRRSTMGCLRDTNPLFPKEANDGPGFSQEATGTQRTRSQDRKQVGYDPLSRSDEQLNTTASEQESAEKPKPPGNNDKTPPPGICRSASGLFFSSHMTPQLGSSQRTKLLDVSLALQAASHLRRSSCGPELGRSEAETPVDLASMREYRYIRLPKYEVEHNTKN